MGKKFAHKLANLLLTFVMVCSCLFVFSACKKDDDTTPPAEATITSISVDVAESSSYTMVEKTIEVNYSSNKRYRFEASDFVVTATKSDSTTEVLSQKTETADGYTLDSTVSTATPTPVNEYKLTFGYTGVQSVEIKVKVNKGVIDVSGVTLESKTYNGSEQILTTADIKNLPENVTASFVSGNSGTNSREYEAELSFTYTGDDAENFETIPNRTISWNINKADYDVSGISWNVYQNDTAVTSVDNIVYNGTAYTAKILGDLPTGVTVRGYNNLATQTNAGTYTATVQFNFNTENYNAPAVPAYTYTIKKAPLTVTAKDKAITFGDEPANNGVTYSGFITGENESTEGLIKGALAFDYSGKLSGTDTHKTYVAGQDAGTYPIVPAGISADNYEITFVNGTLTVSTKTYEYSALSITFNYNAESPFTYNGRVQKPTVTDVPDYVNYQIIATKDGTSNESKDAGSYTATFTPASSSNYTFTGTAPTVAYVINKKALTIKANDKTINFGEEKANAGVTPTGLVAGETLKSATTGELVYDYGGYGKGSPAGTYTITVSGLSSTNYEITYETGTLTVNKVSYYYSIITITGGSGGTYAYDAETNTYSVTYNGYNNGLVVNGRPTYVSDGLVYKNSSNEIVSKPKDADTYTVTFTVTENNNYEFLGTAPTTTLVINKKALTITAENKEITWGEAVPAYTATYSGFENGETKDTEGIFSGTLAFDCTYTAGSNAGTYDIVPKGLTAKNYEINFVKGTLTVSKVTYNYSDLAWKLNGENVSLYEGVAKYEYNAQAFKPTVDGFASSVTYSVTYNTYNSSTEEAGDVVANPTNVGTYIATLAFNASTDNYEFTGTAISTTLIFEIEKHIMKEADYSKLSFVLKKVSETNSQSFTDVSSEIEFKDQESTGDGSRVYKATIYYEIGYNYEVSFKNELDSTLEFNVVQTGTENLIFYAVKDDPYTFTATVSSGADNYVEIKSFTLSISYRLIVRKLAIQYIPKDSTDSNILSGDTTRAWFEYPEDNEDENYYPRLDVDYNSIQIEGYVTHMSTIMGENDDEDRELADKYACEFSTDRENTTAVFGAVSVDYNKLDSTIYLIIRTMPNGENSTSVVVSVIPINIYMNIDLNYKDASSDSSDSEKPYSIQINNPSGSTTKQLTTEFSALQFAFPLFGYDDNDSQFVSYINTTESSIKFAKYTDNVLSTTKEESITLEMGSNMFRMYITIKSNYGTSGAQRTITYETDIAVICSVSSDYFNVSYGEEGQQNEAYNNSLYVNVYGISDLTGENAETSLEDIVNGISISSKSQEDLGEESNTYDVDEDSRTIECVNGKVYVVFDVTENEAQGGGSSLEDPSDPETTELSNYRSVSLYSNTDISKAKKLYILLNLPFDVDYNTNATFTKDKKDDKIDADEKTIEMVEYECLYITLENENAIIELKNNATNEIRYILTYGSNTTGEYFSEVGTYTLTIKPTAVILNGFIQGSLESYYNVWTITVTEYVPEGSTGSDDYDKEMFFDEDLYPLYPRFDFNDPIDTSITKIEIKVNDKTYTLEDGDVYYDNNIYTVTIGDATYDRKLYKEFLVRSTDKLSIIKDAQTGKVTIQSFTLEGWGNIELYYLEASASNSADSGDNANDQISNVVSSTDSSSISSESGSSSAIATPNFVKITESSFALSVVSHYEFGDTVEFYIKKGSEYYKFTVVFDDSYPTFDGVNPYTKSKPDSLDKFSIKFKDKNGNSHTYSTDTDNFYYAHYEGTVNNVYQYEMYVRMDIETSDVTSQFYKLSTGDQAEFLDCEDITFDFADDGLFANATLETYMWYKNSNDYVDYSEKRIVAGRKTSDFGEYLRLTARFTVGSGDDAETYIWTVCLIFKNSMPIPNEPDENVSYFSSHVEGIDGDDKHKGFSIDCAIDEDANLVGDFIITDYDSGKMLEFTAYIGEDKLAYTTTTGEGADAVTMLEFSRIMLGASVVNATYMIDCNKETDNKITLTAMEYGSVNYLVAMSPKFVVKDNQIKIKVINFEGESNESVYYFIIVFGDNPNGNATARLFEVVKLGNDDEPIIDLMSVVDTEKGGYDGEFKWDEEHSSKNYEDNTTIDNFVAYVNSSLLESGATTYILDYVLLGEYVTENSSAIKLLDGNKTEDNEITIEDIAIGTETIKGAKNATFVVKDNKIVIRIEYTLKQVAGPDGQLSPVTTGTTIYTIVFGTKPASQTTSNN